LHGPVYSLYEENDFSQAISIIVTHQVNNMLESLTAIFVIALALIAVPVVYLYLQAWGSARKMVPVAPRERPTTRFLIAIPAHDEDTVIAATVRHLLAQNYPPALYSVHVVADHCTDQTAQFARQAGATPHERNEGPRTGKGAALSWLLERVLPEGDWDAVVIFDADTQATPDFLRTMDARLAQGHEVIQGNHIIRNPGDGWFPALTWAMYLVDNRFQNLGRSNLGWSAKHMGDCICLQAEVLQKMGFGQGLTEDYHLRQLLLLEGIRIVFEPAARGYGEAARNLAQARSQRARWLQGPRDANRETVRSLLREGLRRRDSKLLDGAFQGLFPSYSTLTMLSFVIMAVALVIDRWLWHFLSPGLIVAWAILTALLFFYPFIGLALEKAPARAYVAILAGPFFVLWRTWLALKLRLGRTPVTWVRTPHGNKETA
jgi:cellulose synthase/poly-beta-1,6-N-acetylglucosamine synthase-like glycosyltransferase